MMKLLNIYFWLALVVILFSVNDKSKADEVREKTDGTFVGDTVARPINSYFIGNNSKSVNSSFMGDDIEKQTDSGFVGANTIMPQKSIFAGESYQQEVRNGTVAPFAEHNSQTPKDGTFIGEDVKKKTDGSFVGNSFGQ